MASESCGDGEVHAAAVSRGGFRAAREPQHFHDEQLQALERQAEEASRCQGDDL